MEQSTLSGVYKEQYRGPSISAEGVGTRVAITDMRD